MIAIAGACRIDELKKMAVNDIQEKGNVLVFKIPDSKTGRSRSFTVTDKMCEGVNPITIYRKYRSLRPAHTPHNFLFIFYRLGKCSTQPVGIHTIGKIPSLIATYLKLSEPKMYTGHCFRRTSASLLADTGANILSLKQHGGWKSTTVAEGYLESSLTRKEEIATRILQGRSMTTTHDPSTSSSSTDVVVDIASTSNQLQPINVSNNQNCTITININKHS